MGNAEYMGSGDLNADCAVSKSELVGVSFTWAGQGSSVLTCGVQHDHHPTKIISVERLT